MTKEAISDVGDKGQDGFFSRLKKYYISKIDGKDHAMKSVKAVTNLLYGILIIYLISFLLSLEWLDRVVIQYLLIFTAVLVTFTSLVRFIQSRVAASLLVLIHLNMLIDLNIYTIFLGILLGGVLFLLSLAGSIRAFQTVLAYRGLKSTLETLKRRYASTIGSKDHALESVNASVNIFYVVLIIFLVVHLWFIWYLGFETLPLYWLFKLFILSVLVFLVRFIRSRIAAALLVLLNVLWAVSIIIQWDVALLFKGGVSLKGLVLSLGILLLFLGGSIRAFQATSAYHRYSSKRPAGR